MRKLSENEAEQIRALSHASQIPLAQRKRENEALRRRMKHPNLRAGLLQKYQSVQSDSGARSLSWKYVRRVSVQVCVSACMKPTEMLRFQFLKAFLLDKDNLASIEVEAFWIERLVCSYCFFALCPKLHAKTCLVLLYIFEAEHEEG